MFEYLITKYDPRKRDAQGRYLAEEWTMYAQVGQVIAGHSVTMDEYLRTEKAYIDATIQLLAACDIVALTVRDLQNAAGQSPSSFELREGATLTGESLREAVRRLLREEVWCRLEGEDGSYVHVGWDYYLYVGVPCVASTAVNAAHADGLFVELAVSPYKV